MTHSKATNRTSTYSKWLLTATLCLSFFAFSGYSAEPQPGQFQITKTELVLTTNPNSGRIASHLSLLYATHQLVAHDFNVRDLDRAVLRHTRLIKTTLNSLTKHFLFFNPVARFHPLKTIPQSTDEDSFNSLKG